MTAGSVICLFVLVLAAGFFALNVQRLGSSLRVGPAKNVASDAVDPGRNLHATTDVRRYGLGVRIFARSTRVRGR